MSANADLGTCPDCNGSGWRTFIEGIGLGVTCPRCGDLYNQPFLPGSGLPPNDDPRGD